MACVESETVDDTDSGVKGLMCDDVVVPDSGVRGLRFSADANRAAVKSVETAVDFPCSPANGPVNPGAVKTTGGRDGDGAVGGWGDAGAVTKDLYSVGGGFHELRLKLLAEGFFLTLALYAARIAAVAFALTLAEVALVVAEWLDAKLGARWW